MYDGRYTGYKLPLGDGYRGIDELGSKICSKYTIPKESPIAWGMIYPSRHFSLTVSYPPEVKAIVNLFGFEEQIVDQDDKMGFYNLRYGSWLLPDSGNCNRSDA